MFGSKKKISELEDQIVLLVQEIGVLKGRNEQAQALVDELRGEKQYFKALIDRFLVKTGSVPVTVPEVDEIEPPSAEAEASPDHETFGGSYEN